MDLIYYHSNTMLVLLTLEGYIYKAGAKVVFVAEICQRGNFTKASGLTFQTYSKNKNSINRTLQKLFGDNFVKFKDISHRLCIFHRQDSEYSHI
jgi:hypothetical protein